MKDTQAVMWVVKPVSFMLYLFFFQYKEFYLQQLKVWNLWPNPFVLIFIESIKSSDCNTMQHHDNYQWMPKSFVHTEELYKENIR